MVDIVCGLFFKGEWVLIILDNCFIEIINLIRIRKILLLYDVKIKLVEIVFDLVC